MTPSTTPFDPGQLRLTRDLVRLGVEPKEEHTQIRRGVWLPTTLARDLSADRRHAAFVHATSLVSDPEQPHTFWGPSAAAVWGLPRIGAWPTHCDVLITSRRRGSALVRTHRGAPVEPVLIHGVRVTPADRTVVDLARTDSLETAVASADHALREELCTREDLAAIITELPAGSRGRSRAALALDLADGASGSVGESLSRVRMFQLSLPKPKLQAEYRDDGGRIGFVDFDWNGVIGEFDGRLKYGVPPDADPAQAGEVVWREKQREDRLRRRTGKPLARWVWSDALVPNRLASVLAAHGIRPLPRCTWFDLAQSGSGSGQRPA